jgi:hypothetical protein
MSIWSDIAYGLARGWYKAFYEVQDERSRVKEEKPVATDVARTDEFRDKLRTQEGNNPPRP